MSNLVSYWMHLSLHVIHPVHDWLCFELLYTIEAIVAKFMAQVPWLMWKAPARCAPNYFGSLGVPFKYVLRCLHLQIFQLCEITDLAMHWTGMLLNWIHPALDWLCIELLSTVQALTEGATAWGLMDHIPPLEGSTWSCHGSTTLSDAFFVWIALFLSHCWLPRPEESSLQSSMQSCANWVVHLRTWLCEPPRRTCLPMSWLALLRPFAIDWERDCF